MVFTLKLLLYSNTLSLVSDHFEYFYISGPSILNIDSHLNLIGVWRWDAIFIYRYPLCDIFWKFIQRRNFKFYSKRSAFRLSTFFRSKSTDFRIDSSCSRDFTWPFRVYRRILLEFSDRICTTSWNSKLKSDSRDIGNEWTLILFYYSFCKKTLKIELYEIFSKYCSYNNKMRVGMKKSGFHDFLLSKNPFLEHHLSRNGLKIK